MLTQLWEIFLCKISCDTKDNFNLCHMQSCDILRAFQIIFSIAKHKKHKIEQLLQYIFYHAVDLQVHFYIYFLNLK